MAHLHPAVSKLVEDIGARPEVDSVTLFGSRARGDFEPRSDVDLAVDAPGLSVREWLELTRLAEECQTLLSIDLVRLDEAPAGLRRRILEEGVVLFARTEGVPEPA